MNPDLLNSQLATLEIPSDAWPISAAGSLEESIEKILARLREAGLFTTVAET
jgi:gluconate kinase